MEPFFLNDASGSTHDYDIAWEALEQRDVLENPCACASLISMIEFQLVRRLIASDIQCSIRVQKFKDTWNALSCLVSECWRTAPICPNRPLKSSIDDMTTSLYIRMFCPGIAQTVCMNSDEIQIFDSIVCNLHGWANEGDNE